MLVVLQMKASMTHERSLVDTTLSYLMLYLPFISFNLLGRGESRTVQIAESIGLHCYITKLFIFLFLFVFI